MDSFERKLTLNQNGSKNIIVDDYFHQERTQTINSGNYPNQIIVTNFDDLNLNKTITTTSLDQNGNKIYEYYYETNEFKITLS